MKQWTFRPSTAATALRYITLYIEGLPDKEYILEVKEKRKKRSLNANSYAWALINKIAAAVQLSPDEVYQNALKDMGGNMELIPIRNDAVKAWQRIWEDKGLGWRAEVVGPSKEGYTDIACFYGSSVFDTSQMGRLIDILVQDAKALEIETLPPDELDRLVSLWQ